MFLCLERSIERQVLHTQCKRLEVQNYNLTRTAEQLSLTMGVSVRSQLQVFACRFAYTSSNEKNVLAPPHMNHVPLWNLSGADDSEAESAGGEREAAGPAGALQKVFDTTQHAVGQGPAQRPHAKVTSSIGPLAQSSLSGDTTPHGWPGNLATLRTAGTGRSQLSSFLSSLLLLSSMSYSEA